MNWKTIIVIFISLLLFVPFIVSANQAPEADWIVSLGGNREEIINDIIQTSDGGYIATGMTASKSSSDDVYVVKLNQTGGVEWENNYGDIKEDYAKSIRQTSDGGYIIGGGTRSFNVGVIDYYIIKLDSSGEVQWEKKYGGSQTDMCETIIQTEDGGYMAAGQSWQNILEGDMYLIKLDPSGNKEWDKTIGGGLEDGAYDIQQTPDHGYIVAGHTRSTTDGSYKVYIVKTDSGGNVEWSRDFGGGSDDQAFSLEQHRDGYVVAGFTKSHGESSDMYVVKVDLDGDLVWEKTFGGKNTEEVAQSISKTSDGGYILAGKTNQYTYGAYDLYLLKLDSNGNEQWSQVFGGENDDFGYCAIQNSKGGFTAAGQTKSTGFGGDVYIIKTKDPLVSKTSGTSGLGDIPKYGSPSLGIVFCFLMLVTAGLVIRRRS
jgi:PQQ-like domain